jgi:hypothetical protein
VKPPVWILLGAVVAAAIAVPVVWDDLPRSDPPAAPASRAIPIEEWIPQNNGRQRQEFVPTPGMTVLVERILGTWVPQFPDVVKRLEGPLDSLPDDLAPLLRDVTDPLGMKAPFELIADGTWEQFGRRGTWALDGDVLVLTGEMGHEQRMRVQEDHLDTSATGAALSLRFVRLR